MKTSGKPLKDLKSKAFEEKDLEFSSFEDFDADLELGGFEDLNSLDSFDDEDDF